MTNVAAQSILLYGELTQKIIGAAMEVHRILGPGYLESVYEEALSHELQSRGILYERQRALTVRYKSIIAGKYIADLVIEDKVIIELKAIRSLTKTDEAQLLNYLRATGIRVGLLLNFGAQSLQYSRRVL